jgi:hypothetical protein
METSKNQPQDSSIVNPLSENSSLADTRHKRTSSMEHITPHNLYNFGLVPGQRAVNLKSSSFQSARNENASSKKRSEETKGISDNDSIRPLYRQWVQSRLNLATRDNIEKNRQYLWAFGDNSKGQRALSVLLKKDLIDSPEVAYVPAQSKDGYDIGYINSIVSGQEHTVCLTDLGQVLVCGSNQH